MTDEDVQNSRGYVRSCIYRIANNFNKVSFKNSLVYASVKTGESQSYYSFYPDKIVKTTDKAKALIYVVSYEPLQTTYDTDIYRR